MQDSVTPWRIVEVAMTSIRSLVASLGLASACVVGAAAWADTVVHKDAAFLKDAAQAGHMEVEGSRLALSKASSAQVKSFAQQIIDDHARAGAELATLAAAKGVKLSDDPSLAQKAKLKLLGTHEGAKFDAKYAETVGVSAHEDAVKLFSKASTEANDPDVKAFAAKTLPTLQHHLEMARSMQAATGKY